MTHSERRLMVLIGRAVAVELDHTHHANTAVEIRKQIAKVQREAAINASLKAANGTEHMEVA